MTEQTSGLEAKLEAVEEERQVNNRALPPPLYNMSGPPASRQ
jgi:hypothetical protein